MSYFDSDYQDEPTNLRSESQILIDIERFVENVIKMDQLQLLRTASVESKFYLELLGSLPRYLSIYNPSKSYVEHQDAFWAGCEASGLLPQYCTFQESYTSGGRLDMESVSILIATIAHYAKSYGFKRRPSDRLYETKLKNSSIVEYARAIHQSYERVLTVRVDFYFPIENSHRVGIDDVYRFYDTMIDMQSKPGVFDDLIGYAHVIEQGVKRGYHIHGIYYFKGRCRQGDEGIGMQIGELWRLNVTRGLGCYNNCNSKAHKAGFEKRGTLGVGMIHRSDAIACNNAINAASYLARPSKDNQYLRMRPAGRRTFFKGTIIRFK